MENKLFFKEIKKLADDELERNVYCLVLLSELLGPLAIVEDETLSRNAIQISVGSNIFSRLSEITGVV